MLIDLTREDLKVLVLGTGGPGNYEPHKSGQLKGFPNERWEWNMKYIDSLTEKQLWRLYLEFKK